MPISTAIILDDPFEMLSRILRLDEVLPQCLQRNWCTCLFLVHYSQIIEGKHFKQTFCQIMSIHGLYAWAVCNCLRDIVIGKKASSSCYLPVSEQVIRIVSQNVCCVVQQLRVCQGCLRIMVHKVHGWVFCAIVLIISLPMRTAS